MNRNNKKDFQSAIVIIIFAIAFYMFSYKIQPTTSDILGSRFFPRAASVCLMLLGAIQIWKSVRSKDVLTEEELKKIAKNDTINQPLILTSVLLFVYYFLCLGVGFTITSILYLLSSSWILMPETDRKNKKMQILIAIVAIVVPVFLNTVFYRVFHITLPKGMLFK